ncbi:MAG TPA: hypothetical protein VHP38_07035 [Ruminiclostridium sp.]|nr:hypothetical protein [Ruminiclostridium sp.]
MLMIFTALYCEAQPLIKNYKLKRNNNINKFQVFQNDNIILTITNTGSIAAAIAVSYISALFPPAPSDFLINIGICGSADRSITVGNILLCNKITEGATGRSFYPDVLFRHTFSEGSLITCSRIQHDLYKKRDEMLFDMEAAGIYQSSVYYFQPHQISILKIVSDYGTSEMSDPGEVSGLIDKNMPDITQWLGQLQQTNLNRSNVFTLEEETSVKRMADCLQCSVAMEHKLRQILIWYKLTHGSINEEIQSFCLNNKLPCKTKTEGKMYFEQFKAELI